jgi:hypothetical protein
MAMALLALALVAVIGAAAGQPLHDAAAEGDLERVQVPHDDHRSLSVHHIYVQ